MIDRQLKMGIRQLTDGEWYAEDVTFESMDFLFPFDNVLPSEEDKQRFVSRFRARIREAALCRIAGPERETGLATNAGCNAPTYKKAEKKIMGVEPMDKKTEDKKQDL